jgi:hypothetical protein
MASRSRPAFKRKVVRPWAPVASIAGGLLLGAAVLSAFGSSERLLGASCSLQSGAMHVDDIRPIPLASLDSWNLTSQTGTGQQSQRGFAVQCGRMRVYVVLVAAHDRRSDTRTIARRH